MMRMELSAKGVKAAAIGLDRRRTAIKHIFKDTLQDVGDWYLKFLQNDVWETEGAVFGEPWAPLNPKYAKRKAKKYPGAGILEATGTMRSGWKLVTTSNSALIENTAKNKDDKYYAVYHQQEEKKSKKLPQRIIIKMDEQRRTHIYEMFKEGILKRFEDATK